MKNIRVFYLKIFSFFFLGGGGGGWGLKFSIYLNRHVFVMAKILLYKHCVFQLVFFFLITQICRVYVQGA